LICKVLIKQSNIRLLFIFLFTFYQQSGDAKKPYLAQYSAVADDSPVRVS
jgi:hypothetical protein